MIDTKKLTLLDGLMYALDEIREKTSPEVWDAFSRYMQGKPFQYAATGQKCILASDLQLYIRIRSNALKNHNINVDKSKTGTV